MTDDPMVLRSLLGIFSPCGNSHGGVLIRKVYSHLSNEHTQTQAARLNFGPTLAVLPQAARA